MDLILIYERSESLYLGLIHYYINEFHNLISKLLVLFLRQSMSLGLSEIATNNVM